MAPFTIPSLYVLKQPSQASHPTTLSHFTYSMFFSKKDEAESEPPSRSKREICWASRDAYFACLDKYQVDNPLDPVKGEIASSKCGAEDKQFQKDCIASWVKYFKEKRPFDLKKERLLKEAADQGQEIVQMDGYKK